MDNKIFELKNFNFYFVKKNKWTLVFTDKNGKIINYIAIPPTTGNRIDLITNSQIDAGYAMDLNIIIVKIINGEPIIISDF